MELKKCSKCKEEKELSNFGVGKREKDGLQSICKICAKAYRDANKEKTKKYNAQYREDNKNKAKQYSAKYYLKHQDRYIQEARVRYRKNRYILLEKAKQYYIDNKENIYEKKKVYTMNRLKNDSLFKLKMNIRTLIKYGFNKKGIKKILKSELILGCSFQEFRDYLEKQFDDKMNWDNQGSYWHLDHIKPVSLAATEQELIELNHYTNFQPLFWKENLSKSNKYND